MLFFDDRDTLALASDLHLDRTATSNLLLAHSSTFWDTRSAVRTQILRHMVPHLEDLFLMLSQTPAIPEAHEFEEIAIPRLRRLNGLCEADGATLTRECPRTLASDGTVGQIDHTAH